MREMNAVEAWLRWPIDTIRIWQADKHWAPVTPAAVSGPLVTLGLLSSDRATERLEKLIETAVLNAISEIGHGELAGMNNRGPDIARFCAPHGDGWEWCAGFAGYVVEVAAKDLGMRMPYKRSLSAKTSADNIALVGSRFTDVKLARRGDFLVYDRGITGSHHGHIEIIEYPMDQHGLVHVVPGNSNPLVCRRKRDVFDKKLRFREVVSLRPGPAALNGSVA